MFNGCLLALSHSRSCCCFRLVSLADLATTKHRLFVDSLTYVGLSVDIILTILHYSVRNTVLLPVTKSADSS